MSNQNLQIMEARTKFLGFCVILTENRYSNNGKITNVGFSQLEKSWLKKKIGYTSDVETEMYDGIFEISRKIVFPFLTPEQLMQLISDRCLYFSSETMGSLTVEYGWLPAKSYESETDWYNNRTNAYISPLFEFKGFENIEKETHCMKSNYLYQEKLEKEVFEAIDNENLGWFYEVPEFVYNLDQLELQFEM